jgi:ATP-dependent Clp protease ATP-binding subunit ClpC
MNDKERFDKFTERARKVLSLAQEEAQRFNHNYIGTEHLLLGLVREGDGVAAKVLSNLGVELNKVRSAVEFIIGRGDRIVLGDIGLTPRAKKVIELAVDEARRLNHHYIGTEHLLLGLVREGEGIAAGVLESLGVNLEKVRTQTIQVLNQSGSSRAVHGTSRPMSGTWSIPALSVERLAHIQAEMQQTFRIGGHDPGEALDAAQERAYSLARSMSELLAEIARLQEEIRTLRE